ncbi:SIR2 family protein [bacterium]|nr:SIR2 family protein [bacterium]
MELTHDPREFVRGLQQILISDTKRLGFMFGAGTSMAVKEGASKNSVIPGIKEMTQRIIDSISEEEYKKALQMIKEEFEESKIGYYIEYILSNITQKEQVIGNEKLCGLTKKDFELLRKKIEKEIIELSSVHKKKDSFISNLLHCDFAQWIAQASRKLPVEIFTTNYDYLLELGLEHHNVPYFDGFVGSFEPFFSSSSVEDLTFLPQYTKLWKLHGSLGWYPDRKANKIIRRYQDDSTIIVFPSLLKYDNSKKQPYVSFMDRLAQFIKENDGVLFICGYSFSDQHINDVLLNALEKTRTSHVIALYFDELNEDSHVAKLGKGQSKLSVYGKNNAVIGGKFGSWRLKTKPAKDDSIIISLYFDEDVIEPEKEWTGKGNFKLHDFAKFVEFLTYLNYKNYVTTEEKK